MGPDTEILENELYIELSNGYRTKISGIQNINMKDLEDEDNNKKINLNFHDSYSFYITIPNCRHVSKKKFKKWLMGRGISRNDADYLCFSIGYCKGAISYRRIYISQYISQLFNPKLIFADIIKEIWLYEGETK